MQVLFSTRVSPSGDPNLSLRGLRVPAQVRSFTISFQSRERRVIIQELHNSSSNVVTQRDYAVLEEGSSESEGRSRVSVPEKCEGISPSQIIFWSSRRPTFPSIQFKGQRTHQECVIFPRGSNSGVSLSGFWEESS